jgi:hypothetical protein
MRLVDYPYVLVRIRCDTCKRSGRSKLARSADKFAVMQPAQRAIAQRFIALG